ncbi:ABC transporter ATP-binding protein [Mesorhizobium sp. SARCC-RB16n]|uniref:ABC transporter ATP-binding protein n=1 Tax=Mesorhizobium sp. SARCC-RB16n TaxID=2116687 RepID=UPI00166BB383
MSLPPTKKRLGTFHAIALFIAMVWRTSPFLTLSTLLLRLVDAVLPVSKLYVGKLIVDEVSHQIRSGAPALSFHDEQWLLLLIAAGLGLAVFTDLFSRVSSLVEDVLAERVTIASSVGLMEHAATLDLKDFEDAEFQDQLERARVQTSNSMTLLSLSYQAAGLIKAISFAMGLLIIAPWLVVVMLIAVVPAFLGEFYFNARSYSLHFSRMPAQREHSYVRLTATSVEAAKEVKIFGLSRFLIDRYVQLADQFYTANRKLAVRRTMWSGLFTAVSTMAYYGAYTYIVWGALQGKFTVGDLTFLAGSFLQLSEAVASLLLGFARTAGQAEFLKDLFSFFDLEPEILSPENALSVPCPIREGFVFENVGFKYPGAGRWAVRGLSFTLRAGEVLALVGENGAGKTTLVKLLARLYDPNEGRILLDGKDLREYDVAELRNSIGVIFQDFVRYNMTANDNIAVGRIKAREDRDRVERAAERSQAGQVIGRLPGGYDQMIGKQFDNGVELSGGEWQKIAIARAYMRDAELLILDEPTAALDARSESEVFRRFKELSKGKTSVLISHRFSSVRMADRILVLADGKVEAQGTHEELLAERGRYAELFELQASGYR